ncbi:YesL family protein [Actinomyces succiniciruminis]|uniref:Drug resistance transporter, EmrB/QacA sub protein n=1 Tax=Actinomyces succiniciruminis TaxID=1522002 RepID=A0A1L7RE92_9ACTO|nr:DUF624 domain-containing protein [Actinomyces succiniciruminis]CED92351.1 Drug resistance transporter, EmrB/QacA sub protein [Actinomyces succiniciruminis]
MRSVALGYERLCRVIMLVATINAAFVVHTLAGAVVLGFFPSVGAAFTTYRTWLLDEDHAWRARRAWSTFHTAWRAELRGANRFGWAQAAVGALLAWDYYLANWNLLGGVVGIGVSGLLLVINAGYAVAALAAWAVRAHVEAPLGWTLRAAVAVACRARCTVSMVVLLGVSAWVWSRWPGVFVAFGPSMVVGVVAAAVYTFGGLPGLEARAMSRRRAASTGAAAGRPATASAL